MNLTDPFSIIFSPLTSWRSRFIYLVVILLIAFWVDSQMGFTYHYFTQRKIDEIHRYNEMLDNKNIDSATRHLIMKERFAVITKNRAILEPSERQEKAHGVLFHISYSWIYIALILFGPSLIKKGDPYMLRDELRKQVLGMWVALIILIGFNYFAATWMSKFLSLGALYSRIFIADSDYDVDCNGNN